MRKGIYLLSVIFMLAGCSVWEVMGTVENTDKICITMSYWEPGAKNELGNAFRSVAEDYKKVCPNVQIEFLEQSVHRYRDWIKERQAESALPTIMYNEKANILDMNSAGLIYRLDQALISENPYQENAVWKDSFKEEMLTFTHDYDAKLGLAVPLSGLGLAIYYNQDIYQEYGLTEAKTWREFMDNCQVIEKSGINPIAFMAQKNDTVNWLQWSICTNAFGKKFLQDSAVNLDGNQVISQHEMANSVLTGSYDVQAAPYNAIYIQYLDFVREFSKYAHNAISLDEDGAKEQFLKGRAAHIFTGSWEIRNLLKNEDLAFKTGLMAFPEFTPAETEYGGLRLTIRTATCLAVTKNPQDTEPTAEQEAAVDFLKFLTSQGEYQKYAENTSTIPTVKNIQVDRNYEAFGGDVSPIEIFSIDNPERSGSYSATMRALAGDDSAKTEEMIKNVQKGNIDFAQNYMQKYQK